MIIKNDSLQTVHCIMNEDIDVILLPREQKQIRVDSDEMTISLSHIYGSTYGTCFGLNNVFQIVINSQFKICNIDSASIIKITREKVHFELFYAYDRFFCTTTNCHIFSENHFVSNIEELCLHTKQEVQKDTIADRLRTFFLSGPFLLSTGLFFLFKISFFANDWKFSWFWAFVFWLFGFGVQMIGEKLYYAFPKNRKTDQYQKLMLYSSCEKIMQYYFDPNRTWVGDDIER